MSAASPRRFLSRLESEPMPETVYQALHEHETEIDQLATTVEKLNGSVEKLEGTVATLNVTVATSQANAKGETNKLIVTVVLAALGLLGGNRVINPTPPTPAPVETHVQRSNLDIRLDQCRPMPPGPSRAECYARVTQEVENP
jgi:hypothetical protein